MLQSQMGRTLYDTNHCGSLSMDTSRSRAIASAPAVTIPYIETVVTYGMPVPYTTGRTEAKLLINVDFIIVEKLLENTELKSELHQSVSN